MLFSELGRVGSILHLGGRTRVSRYDMGRMMAASLNIAPDRLRPVRIADMALPYDRAPDCSLDSRRAYRMGYAPTPLAEAIGQMVTAGRPHG